MSTSLLLPGQPLPAQYTAPPLPQCGPGCYMLGDQIVASVVGRPSRDGSIVSVKGREENSAVPDIGAVVIGTISRLTPAQAHLTVSVVNGKPTPESQEEFGGVIRVADIRLTERDKIKIAECFRLGDVVKAVVTSLGDARSYYLSTAQNEYGVISGRSEAGHPLTPVSWQEMEDVVTGAREKRKVAKPDGV